jgi:hypothetical protein
MNAEDTRNEIPTATILGKAFYFSGWAIFALSIVFALSGKTAEPHPVWPYWACVGLLVGASLVYLVGCLFSLRWRSKTVKGHFTSYLLGAAGWLILYLFFWILDRVAG